MKADTNSLSQLLELRKSRTAALEKFRALADTPKSIQQGNDMAELVKSMVESNTHVLAFLNAGEWADAGKEFQIAVARTEALRAKSQEALAWQQYRAARGEESRKQTATLLWISLIVGSLVAVVGAILGGVVLTRSVALPLTVGISYLGRISEGDLSHNTPADLQKRGDEIGALARAMQTMTLSLRAMVQEISGGIHWLALSSAEMMTSSTQMRSGAVHASDRAHSVSAAAEEMSATFVTVAAGMEQTTTNLVHIASATEEMTATISEIAQNSERARSITEQANRQAVSITEQMNQLGITAREIGKVTQTITRISSQTNLLALNATIEAARAGESGQGFAVVANEIKALAQQTTAATEDIRGRIAAVQSATALGTTEIGKVSQVIQDVSAIVASIATAIEEQSASTREIARNINDATTGLKDANLRVSETSSVSREIARDIVSVDHAAGEMASGSDHVRSSASSLAQVAESLKTTVARFHA